MRLRSKGARLVKKFRLWRESNYTDTGFLYLKAHNSYINGTTGVDIRLSLWKRIQILFCGGVSVTIIGNL